MSGFKYPYTCDSIDREIGRCRSELYIYVKDLFKSYQLPHDHMNCFNASEELFSSMSDIFEQTRKINENIRADADKQIKDANEETLEFRAENFKKENEIKRLKKLLDDNHIDY